MPGPSNKLVTAAVAAAIAGIGAAATVLQLLNVRRVYAIIVLVVVAVVPFVVLPARSVIFGFLRRWMKVIVAATLAAAVAASVAWFLFFRDFVSRDHFDEAAIDSKKWVLPPDSAELSQRGGHLSVDVRRPNKKGSSGILIARVPAWKIVKEASATFALLTPADGASQPGGVGLKARLTDGRVLSVDLGPNTEGADAAMWACPSNEVWETNKCELPEKPRVQALRPTSLGITTSGQRIAILVDGTTYYEDKTTAHIRGIELYYYASPGSAFHVTIDDYYMKYRRT